MSDAGVWFIIVTSIIVLALPVTAAIETYLEKKNRRKP